MKEIKVKRVYEGTYMEVKDSQNATHVVLELTTYKNLMRLVKEKAIHVQGLIKKHTGYRVISVNSWDEPRSKTRMPTDQFDSWDIDESKKLDDQITKLDFFEKRKATKKIFVPCFLMDVETPYKVALTEHDLEQVMFNELFEMILPKLGYENDEWPIPGEYSSFNVLWKKENGEYVLANTVYRILLCPNLEDGYWHVHVFATAAPVTIPDEMK